MSQVNIALIPGSNIKVTVPYGLPLTPGTQICFLTPQAPLRILPWQSQTSKDKLPFFFNRHADGFVDIVMPESIRMSEIRGIGVKRIKIVKNMPSNYVGNKHSILLEINDEVILNVMGMPDDRFGTTIKLSFEQDCNREYHGVKIKLPQGAGFIKNIICDITIAIKENMVNMDKYFLFFCP